MSASLPKIRRAVMEDLPQILEMGRALHEENGIMPLSEDCIHRAAINGIQSSDAIMGVIGEVGAVEAMVYLVIGKFWYSEDLHVEELFTYVKPEFRASQNAKAMLQFAKGTAKRLDVPLLIGIVSNTKTKQKVKLYERMLGEPAGAYFLWNGHTGNKLKKE
ncbi:MAG: hypothetical protein P8Y47_03825 [Alphaproteobacteria bacterium]